jgi:hypothetical protein
MAASFVALQHRRPAAIEIQDCFGYKSVLNGDIGDFAAI